MIKENWIIVLDLKEIGSQVEEECQNEARRNEEFKSESVVFAVILFLVFHHHEVDDVISGAYEKDLHKVVVKWKPIPEKIKISRCKDQRIENLRLEWNTFVFKKKKEFKIKIPLNFYNERIFFFFSFLLFCFQICSPLHDFVALIWSIRMRMLARWSRSPHILKILSIFVCFYVFKCFLKDFLSQLCSRKESRFIEEELIICR